MNAQDIVSRYNYDKFVPEKVAPWINFDNSPALGHIAPDFPLWHLDATETSLLAICKQHLYTIVEFGSFT